MTITRNMCIRKYTHLKVLNFYFSTTKRKIVTQLPTTLMFIRLIRAYINPYQVQQ